MSLSILNNKPLEMKCNLCGSSQLSKLIDFGHHPVAKHYLVDPNQHSDVYSVKLFMCEECGLTQLQDACPPDVVYDNYVTLSSWKFQPHCQHEIDVLEELSGISKNAKVVEIGSNDGSFLKQMKENGYVNVLGVEPAKDACDLARDGGVPTVNQFLTKGNVDDFIGRYGDFDLCITRQNLEHISDLGGIAYSISRLVREGGWLLVEVPNFECNLSNRDYSLWEEHVNYFVRDTLRSFLDMAGFSVVHEEIFTFSGEGIFVLAEKGGGVSAGYNGLEDIKEKNNVYACDFPSFQASVGGFLAEIKDSGKKIAVYGAGARVICWVNFLGLGKYIDVFVDDQPEKQDKFVPGCRTPIIGSKALYDMGIDVCLLGVNTENEHKVIEKHGAWVDGGGQFWSVLPPSSMLIPIW